MLTLCDTTLRDGSHAVRHTFAPEQVREIAGRLAAAGVPIVEVSHGDGLGGSSITYGRSAHDEMACIEAAAEVCGDARLAVLLLPGIGTRRELERAAGLGATAVRIATHCTEADIAIQHIRAAKELGLLTIGFLMMSHSQPPEVLREQAQLMADSGADVVYVTDSAGALVPGGVRERVEALRRIEGIEVGFHAHNNLGCAVGNTLAAIDAGATYLDGCLCGLGAGAGNTQLEALVAAMERAGHETGVDLFALLDVAEALVRPLAEGLTVNDRTIVQGYAGVYSSFLRHAEHLARTYEISPRDLLVEAGRRGAVGGQEDLMLEIAVGMKAAV